MSKYFTIIIIAIFLILPQAVSAFSFVPCGTSEHPERCSICHIFIVIQTLITGFGAAIVVWAIFWTFFGGFAILTSAGVPERVSQGKRMITYAIIGVVVCFCAWLIVNTVMNAFINRGKMPWPWNRIQCAVPPAGNGEEDGEIVGDKNYCICETPVYTVSPKDYPSLFSVLGTEIKGTELDSEESCESECVKGNAANYCYIRSLTDLNSQANLYCANKGEIESKQAACVRVEDIPNDQIACFDSVDACYTTVTAGVAGANKECVANCWVDGNRYCYCTEGQGTACTSSAPHALVIDRKEKTIGTFLNAFSCIKNCDYSQGRCRLGGFQGLPECKSGKIITEWRFQAGVEYQDEQKADASTALTNFLNCFYQKAPSSIGNISAITDKDIYNGTCNPQDCKYSTCTVANCGSGQPCDHACHSCHYGGTCSTVKSYAVDFGDQENVCQIADAALQCSGVNKIFGPQTCGGKVTADGYHASHVHISVTNSCNCN